MYSTGAYTKNLNLIRGSGFWYLTSILNINIWLNYVLLNSYTFIYLMSGWFLNGRSVMRPRDCWSRISLDPAFEKKPFSIVFLSNGWFFRESRRDTVDLPVWSERFVFVGIVSKQSQWRWRWRWDFRVHTTFCVRKRRKEHEIMHSHKYSSYICIYEKFMITVYVCVCFFVKIQVFVETDFVVFCFVCLFVVWCRREQNDGKRKRKINVIIM